MAQNRPYKKENMATLREVEVEIRTTGNVTGEIFHHVDCNTRLDIIRNKNIANKYLMSMRDERC